MTTGVVVSPPMESEIVAGSLPPRTPAGTVLFGEWVDADTFERVERTDRSRNRRCDVVRADGQGGTVDAGVVLHLVEERSIQNFANTKTADDARRTCARWVSLAYEFGRNFRFPWLREDTGAFTEGAPTVLLKPFVPGNDARYALTWPCDDGSILFVVNSEDARECGDCFGCAAERALPAARVDSWVYFVQATTGGPVKIGRSSSPQARVASLQTANAAELRIVAMMPGGATVERAMHATFAADRVRPGGEWFNPSPTLAAFVKELGGKIA